MRRVADEKETTRPWKTSLKSKRQLRRFHAEVTETARQAPRDVTLGPRDVLNGSLTIEGDLHIEGTVEGEINASGDVDVEASATVRARVDGRNVTVRGNVSGNVTARGTADGSRQWRGSRATCARRGFEWTMAAP